MSRSPRRKAIKVNALCRSQIRRGALKPRNGVTPVFDVAPRLKLFPPYDPRRFGVVRKVRVVLQFTGDVAVPTALSFVAVTIMNNTLGIAEATIPAHVLREICAADRFADWYSALAIELTRHAADQAMDRSLVEGVRYVDLNEGAMALLMKREAAGRREPGHAEREFIRAMAEEINRAILGVRR